GVLDDTLAAALPRLCMYEEELTTELWGWGDELEGCGLMLTEAGALLMAGSEATGPYIDMIDSTEMSMVCGTAEMTLTAAGLAISVGTVMILLTDASITLTCGAASITLTDAGTISFVGITTFTA
ncbi:MAG: hypothetical protein AB7K24_07105, partial [Gemmataceae bacterium]